MSVQPNNQFLTLPLFKKMLKSTDTQDDDLYLQFVNDSNRKTQTAIYRYIDTPLDAADPIFSRCRDAALAYARHLHAIDIELIDKSNTYMENYNIEMYGDKGTEGMPMAGGIIQQLIALRTNRTKTALVVHDPRNFKVPLPTQNDLFTSERFG